MSNIPYAYQTPTPRSFFQSKFLDPQKENYTNRRKFIDWILNNCYSKPWPRNGVHYDAYELSFSIETAAEAAGMTIKAFKNQLDLYLENGWMTKKSNDVKNRQNFYRFEAHKFGEKIVSIEKEDGQTQEIKEKSMGPTDLRVETQQKGPTESEKGQPKDQQKGQPIYETKQAEKGQPKGQQKDHFYKSDRAIESSLLNSDNVAKPRVRENLSLSSKGQLTAFFNPRSYRLRNGEPLSLRTQNAFCKYSEDERKRLLANVQYYEEYVDSGGLIKTKHEQFLQVCINKDLAMKRENSEKNDLLARVMKEEFKMNEMSILKTTILIKKSDCEEPLSISKELPNQTFTSILDNYINTYYPGFAHAT